MVGRPTVLFTKGDDGQMLEPFERVHLDLPSTATGGVTSLFQERKAVMLSYDAQTLSNRVRLVFEIPTRGLLGVRSKYLSATRGEGLMSTEFSGYKPFKGDIVHRVNGAIVADRNGDVTEYALRNLEDRGIYFLQPGTKVYEGMIVGESNKDAELNVNIVREKKLTNMRASHLEALVHLQGVRAMTLEDCIEWIDEDEWIEVTPKTIRMRKKVLACNQRSVHRSDRLAENRG
jgi:GTP-binding protein